MIRIPAKKWGVLFFKEKLPHMRITPQCSKGKW
jgi:hypothetical protein